VAQTDSPRELFEFAREFFSTRQITHHTQVHTDDLADSFRARFRVPSFARLPDLHQLCRRLEVPVTDLPPVSEDLLAANTWLAGDHPSIHLRPDLGTKRAEHSLGHELREVIENAFKRADRDYVGIDTRDNYAMNRESDHFASCLLMPQAESKRLMRELGYDLMLFAQQTTRPLPSVIYRTQSLFSANSGAGPIGGIWLFEAPWSAVAGGKATASDMRVTASARLNGFSMAKRKGQSAELARAAFPSKHSRLAEYELGTSALHSRSPKTECLTGFDMFEEQDFVVAAEPLFVRGTPWRVLLTGIRLDFSRMVKPWLARLGARQLDALPVTVR
jgi:hypothetical protein